MGTTNIGGKEIDKNEYDVVVVGLGPTGLTFGHFLGKAGIKVLILEKEAQFYGNARAVYTDDECMRIFQQVGIAEDLHEDMLIDTPVTFTKKDGTPLFEMMDSTRPLSWPRSNFLYQPYLETKMADQLDQYDNVTVVRSKEVVDFAQDEQGVTVSFVETTGDGYGTEEGTKKESQETFHVRAKYLVGCDGGRSVTRSTLNIGMQGKTYKEPWIVVDIKAKDGEEENEIFSHLPYFMFICDPDCPTVSCPQPDGYHRFEFMLKEGDTKEYMEKESTVRSLIGEYVDPDKITIMRKLVYNFNALVADKWQDGRVFLAGDAAHMTPQFIGQGMNAGVRDAYNLSWKLIAVLNQGASPTVLESYQSERFQHVKKMIALAVELKAMVSMTNPLGTKLRDLFMKGANNFSDKLKIQLLDEKVRASAQLENKKYLGMARTSRNGPEGDLMPQPIVRDPQGKLVKLDEVLGDGFSVIGVSVNPKEELDTELVNLLENMGAQFVTVYGRYGRPQGTEPRKKSFAAQGVAEVDDHEEELVSWLRKSGSKKPVAIVRPDRFIFSIIDKPSSVKSSKKILNEYFSAA